MNKYSAELKAQVIAEWMAGATELGLSERYRIPRTNIRRWVKGHERPIKPTVEDFDLDAMARDLVREQFRAAKAILAALGESEYVKAQGVADLAVFFGVNYDKLLRVLAAFTRHAGDGDPEDGDADDRETAPAQLPAGPGGAAQPG